MNQKFKLVLDKDDRFVRKMRKISPIRNRKEKVLEECEIIDGKKSDGPLYLVTTNSRSLCSTPDSRENVGERDLEFLRRKVREIEIRVQDNFYQIEKGLDENDNLNIHIQILEEKLKNRHSKSLLDKSTKEVFCESKCLII